MSAPSAEAIEAALLGTPFSGLVECRAELRSTIDRCRELAEEGAPEGCVVIAGAQSAGRGQPGRSWHSPEDAGLFLSVLLRPALPASQVDLLAPAWGLAACEGVRGFGIACRLKLPNDLVVVRDGAWRKLGGMLVDTAIMGDRLRHAILSVGVNVALRRDALPADIREIAASCHELCEHPPTREMLAATILREVADLLDGGLEGDVARARILARHAAHVREVVPLQPARPGDD